MGAFAVALIVGVTLAGLVILGFIVALPFGLANARRTGRAIGLQRATLQAVDLSALSDADRVRWQSYEAILGRLQLLSQEQVREVRSWPTR